mmetsp:Transcript_9837/g.26671  ORF Transcript_9837/g.26671 Transcript_9837/m.26671 type:complete len:287 (-) Transcript_9837:179-1039(-)
MRPPKGMLLQTCSIIANYSRLKLAAAYLLATSTSLRALGALTTGSHSSRHVHSVPKRAGYQEEDEAQQEAGVSPGVVHRKPLRSRTPSWAADTASPSPLPLPPQQQELHPSRHHEPNKNLQSLAKGISHAKPRARSGNHATQQLELVSKTSRLSGGHGYQQRGPVQDVRMELKPSAPHKFCFVELDELKMMAQSRGQQHVSAAASLQHASPGLNTYQQPSSATDKISSSTSSGHSSSRHVNNVQFGWKGHQSSPMLHHHHHQQQQGVQRRQQRCRCVLSWLRWRPQ